MLLTGAVVALNCVFLLLYLTTPSSFPRPLSPEEEARCLTLARQGDADARARLIEHNLRLVAHIVKKYYTSGEQDDLISIGTIGLIKAVDSFDAGKGIRLATYAARCIENATLSQRTFCPLPWRIAHPRRKKTACILPPGKPRGSHAAPRTQPAPFCTPRFCRQAWRRPEIKRHHKGMGVTPHPFADVSARWPQSTPPSAPRGRTWT